jgi:radical SAM superfamily enzyme YgiQ (UPF0313 family)
MRIPQFSDAGVDQLAGFLRKEGYFVDILYFHNDETQDDIRPNIPFGYDYYGFNVDITNVGRCYGLATFIKTQSAAKILFGGAFVASCYREIFDDCPAADYVVLGSGEEPLLYLLTHFDPLERDAHPNIATRTSLERKSFHENTRLDFPRAEDYYMRYSASSGFYTHCLQTKNNTCTGACSFCINWCMKRSRMDFHYRSTESMVDEMVRIHRLYQISHFFFIDDDLMDPCTREGKDRILALCKAIIASGLQVTFGCYLKANSLRECAEDELLLDFMYQAGFVFAFVGIESGSQHDLTLFRKIATVEDNRSSIKLLYKHHIKPEYEMIVFHPYSTRSSLEENFLFLEEFRSFNLRHYSSSAVSIYKNTALWWQALADALLTEDYSYKTPDAYRYLDPSVGRIADFLRTRFVENRELDGLVTADQLVTQYYRFSRYAQPVQELEAAVEKVKRENFELLHDYFAPLYLCNDFAMCERRWDSFLLELKFQGKVVQSLINRMIKLSMLDIKR